MVYKVAGETTTGTNRKREHRRTSGRHLANTAKHLIILSIVASMTRMAVLAFEPSAFAELSPRRHVTFSSRRMDPGSPKLRPRLRCALEKNTQSTLPLYPTTGPSPPRALAGRQPPGPRQRGATRPVAYTILCLLAWTCVCVCVCVYAACTVSQFVCRHPVPLPTAKLLLPSPTRS